MKLFKRQFTEWIPLGIHTHGYVHYLVLVRKNKSNGMLQFKSRRVQKSHYCGIFIPYDLIDVKTQWKIITEL